MLHPSYVYEVLDFLWNVSHDSSETRIYPNISSKNVTSAVYVQDYIGSGIIRPLPQGGYLECYCVSYTHGAYTPLPGQGGAHKQHVPY